MIDDETSNKTIAELHDLDENDPWQSPESDKKRLVDARKQLQDKIFDGIPQDAIDEPDVFVDPEDDEDLTIHVESSLSLFWRMVVPNKRVIDIVDLDPNILKITMVAKNNIIGCCLRLQIEKLPNVLDDY
jgi:hypothetical protein